MNIGIDLLLANLGFSIENIVLLVLAVGGIIFYARSIIIGIMFHMVAFFVLFIVLYETHLYYINALIAGMIALVALALSLVLVAKSAQQTGVI
jgi:hypothetical protein